MLTAAVFGLLCAPRAAKNKVIIREEGTIGPTVLLLASENVKIQLAAVRLLRSLSVNGAPSLFFFFFFFFFASHLVWLS